MTARRPSRFASFLGVMGSAIAVSAAIEGGRRPRSRDLRELGIDPDQFGRISR